MNNSLFGVALLPQHLSLLIIITLLSPPDTSTYLFSAHNQVRDLVAFASGASRDLPWPTPTYRPTVKQVIFVFNG